MKRPAYNPQDFALLDRYEERHAWFVSRRRLVLDAIDIHAPQATSCLEVGSGTGFVLSAIRHRLTGCRAFGSDLYAEALRVARRRERNTPFFAMDIENPSTRAHFDLVVALDVVEHIDDDRRALRNLSDAVEPGGKVFISVPQHPCLWSVVDDYGHHRRRYRRAELIDKVEDAGLVVERVTSFVSLPLPLMLVSRLLLPKRVEDYDPTSEIRIGATANTLLGVLLSVERRLIRWGVSFPVGGSLFLVASKLRTARDHAIVASRSAVVTDRSMGRP